MPAASASRTDPSWPYKSSALLRSFAALAALAGIRIPAPRCAASCSCLLVSLVHLPAGVQARRWQPDSDGLIRQSISGGLR